MRVVAPWPDEFVAPTIVLVRRTQSADATYGPWEIVRIAIAKQVQSPCKVPPPAYKVLEPPSKSDPAHIYTEWRLAKYFVLQGAIHRTTMVEHAKVHFPHDVTNAMTKAVLPEWYVLQQILLPHFWLTLAVNNAVLEGERSIINRDTWYPWSPLAARGDQARKPLAFAWAGYLVPPGGSDALKETGCIGAGIQY